jgi:hypothetical protein
LKHYEKFRCPKINRTPSLPVWHMANFKKSNDSVKLRVGSFLRIVKNVIADKECFAM